MPALFSLGQHSSLIAVRETLQPTECLMAFLDDIYLVSQPERTAFAHRELGHQLWTRTGISLHAGKTQIWNKSGRCPPGCEGIFEAAGVADPNAVVWKGDQTLPTDQQVVVVLGAPLGHAHFVATELQAMTEVLFRRILAAQDLQCAWHLLLFCGAKRANHFLRVVQPAWSERFVAAHDENVWNWTQELLDIEGTVRVRQLSSLPVALGVLGLRSAIRSQTAPYWASWADSLPRIRERHPRIADLVGVALFRGRFPEGSNLQAAATCRERLPDVGFDAPECRDVARGQRPGRSPENRDPTEPRFGWQCLASADVKRTHLQSAVWPELSLAGRALLRSQCGPFAGIPFTCSPVVVESRLEPQIFRVAFAHFCRCDRPLDVRGHHRSACGRAGELGR